jgi:hypothetical protein
MTHGQPLLRFPTSSAIPLKVENPSFTEQNPSGFASAGCVATHRRTKPHQSTVLDRFAETHHSASEAS